MYPCRGIVFSTLSSATGVCYDDGMIVVIIAGGSGTRLWPLSTPEYPKQLLKVNGDSRSLLQNTYERAKRITDSVYVVPEIGHIDHVREQLPELSDEAFVVEPARRGTANCILAALAHIAQRHDPDEPIASIHADHYVRDVKGFTQSFKVADRVSRKNGRLVLVGVEPDHASTGFGYIQKGDVLDGSSYVYNVQSFKEKPDAVTAQKYLRSGDYLWNCGYFVGSLNTFKKAMQTYAPDLYASYEQLTSVVPQDYEKTYLGLESAPIDVALIEKVQDLLVVPASFDWMDLGSFGDLYKAAIEQDENGNHVEGKVEIEEVQSSFIANLENKPVAVIGLDNVVVVNTPSGIVVARKDMSQKIGDVSKRFTQK